MGTATITITVAGMRGISEILGPVFLALVLTIAVHPLRLLDKRMPGWLVTVIVLVTVYAFLIGFAVGLLVATAQFAELLPTYKEEMTSTIQDITNWLAHLGVDQAQITAIGDSFDVGKLIGLRR